MDGFNGLKAHPNIGRRISFNIMNKIIGFDGINYFIINPNPIEMIKPNKEKIYKLYKTKAIVIFHIYNYYLNNLLINILKKIIVLTIKYL